jgi:hypothetical protein
LAAHVGHRRPALDLPQSVRNLLFRELRPFHLRLLPPQRGCPKKLPDSSCDCRRLVGGGHEKRQVLIRAD